MNSVRFALEPRTLWIAAALLLGVGYLAVTTHYEGAIGASIDRSQRLFEQTAANETAIRNGTRLQTAQNQVRRDFRRFRRLWAPAEMANLLKLLGVAAEANHVRIVRVTPQAQPARGQSIGSRKADTAELVSQEIDLGIKGKFRDVLRLLAELPERDVLLSVDSAKLSIEHVPEGQNQTPNLDATIHATLYKITNRQLLKAGLDETN